MWKKIFWGKKTPRRFVYCVGLYTIGSSIYDVTKASFTQNAREPLPIGVRYGHNTAAVITGASSSTG